LLRLLSQLLPHPQWLLLRQCQPRRQQRQLQPPPLRQ